MERLRKNRNVGVVDAGPPITEAEEEEILLPIGLETPADGPRVDQELLLQALNLHQRKVAKGIIVKFFLQNLQLYQIYLLWVRQLENLWLQGQPQVQNRC